MNIEIVELLNKKDNTEVYEVIYNNELSIFKTHFIKENFYRELHSLKALSKNKLTPKLVSFKDNFESESFGYLIEEKLAGETLLNFKKVNNIISEEIIWKCGFQLGNLNTSLTKVELCESDIWKYYSADNRKLNFSEYEWRDHFYYQIPIWINTIDKNSININFNNLSEFLLKELKKINNGYLGFIHRDYGFRNILTKNNEISGIIDYEHSMIGDIFFDTTKLIFNDLDFIKDASLVRKFFDGWKAATNIEIDEKKLWLYLTIQGIGAIQWVDKQKLEINRKNNIGYRNKSIDIVKLGLENLKYEGLN